MISLRKYRVQMLYRGSTYLGRHTSFMVSVEAKRSITFGQLNIESHVAYSSAVSDLFTAIWWQAHKEGGT